MVPTFREDEKFPYFMNIRQKENELEWPWMQRRIRCTYLCLDFTTVKLVMMVW
jgi:hypothetical protein